MEIIIGIIVGLIIGFVVGKLFTAKGASEEKAQLLANYQVKVSDSYINQFAVGKKFSVRGYQLVDKSGTIVIPNISDITVK